MKARVTNVNMQLMATCKRPALTNFSSFTKTSLLLSKRACPSTASMKAGPQLNHSAISTELILSSDQNPTRRSGNYKPTEWDFEYIQSINNDHVGEKYKERYEQLKKEIKDMINNVAAGSSEELDKLELIDNLERLGVSYHFKEEIMQILKSIHQKSGGDHSNSAPTDSLYSAALKFRLLREYGFDISEDTLNNFKDEDGNFKQSLRKDIKGLLQLYEASFYATETESTLKFATIFAKSQLKDYLDHNQYSEDNLRTLVCHTLELPLHWMMLRLETSWYINIYERMPNANPLLLELARSDVNIVQATHQEELKNLSRWWKSTCLAEKLPFSRDRLVEDFFWTVGIVFEPQHGYCRRVLTKVIAFIIAIDDVYDVYGTLDELEVFTDAVERWDIKAMDHLPDYMKVCYLAFFNTINEIAYDILKEQGIDVLPYLTKPWADLCKAYLQEARWYNNGYWPTLQEYMDNGWISIAIPVILVHAYFAVTKPITKEALESLSKYPDIIRLTSTIIRFVDDLGTSSHELKRGDVPKSIQCYMEEKGASEEEGREHINILLKKTWEQMNEAIQSGNSSPFSETFVRLSKNFGRTAHCVYQHGDGHGIQNSEIKNNISKILFEPITTPN